MIDKNKFATSLSYRHEHEGLPSTWPENQQKLIKGIVSRVGLSTETIGV
jgi:hypothetical protein